MSPDIDRVAVPTNGRKPHPAATTDVPTPTAAEPPASTAGSAAAKADPATPGMTDQELSVAFTPKQLAIGFGIVASLVLLAVGRARRGRSGR